MPGYDDAVGIMLAVLDALTSALAPLSGGAAAAAAVVLLTVAVRLALVPLAVRRAAAAKAQAALAPRVKVLTDRFRGDPVRLSTEVSALYRAEGVTSPLRSMLPMLLQLPVFTLLYAALQRSAANSQELFGVPLGAHGLDAGWLLAVLLAGLTAVAAVSARRMRAGGSPRWLTVTPFLTLVPALFAPLTLGLYLLTSTAWSAGEAVLLAAPS